jgi:hypothetical protein
MSRRAASLVALGPALALLGLGVEATAYCPSYTHSSAYNNNNCGFEAVPGTDPSTAQWLTIFDLVARGPDAWSGDGPPVANIGEGCGAPEANHQVSARFPCELLQAIAMAESGWTQFCIPETPADQVGGAPRTIISFDCGYGVGQVTSGMHTGESPGFDQMRVAAEPFYNMATGARILGGKWSATPCVGDNQPQTIEHWYTATWAYNGLAFVNNPNNPNYDPNRGIFDPAVGGSRPYQEKVFGRMEHTGGLWTATALAYPNPGGIPTTGGSPPKLPEPNCASPTDCVATRPVHQTICTGEGGAAGAGGAGGTGTGGAGATGGSTGGSDGGAASGGDPGQGGSTASPYGIAGGDSGCGCRVGTRGHTRQLPGGVAAWIGLCLLARRRRKPPRPVG